MMRVWSLACLALLSVPACASTLYVSSDLGHELTIVHRRASAGSSIDANKYEVFKLRDDGFDQAFVQHVAAIGAKSNPQLRVVRFTLGADAETDSKGDDALVASALAQVKEREPGDRIMVLIPRRMPIQFAVIDGSAGSGRAAGLGAYVDSDRDWTDTARENDRAGTLAMFANFRIAIIDPATRKVVYSQDSATGEARSGSTTTGADAWDAIPPEQKIELLKSVVNREIDRFATAQIGALQ